MRIIKDESGIAMTEGVIVLPVFIILLIGYPVLHNKYLSRLDAQAEASDLTLEKAGIGRCESEKIDDGNLSEIQGDNFFHKMAGDMIPLIYSRTSSVVTQEIDGFGDSIINVKGKRTMTCNNEPKYHIWDVISGIFQKLFDAVNN